ncbi:MAG: tetratricopeptide repeat protein, partial [Kiloniellales bacterium]|nr:tetratricopeptide repeat protein [Kiloniellales bacterium]
MMFNWKSCYPWLCLPIICISWITVLPSYGAADAQRAAELCLEGASSPSPLTLELTLDHCREALESKSLSEAQRAALLTQRARAFIGLESYTSAANDLKLAKALDPAYSQVPMLQSEIYQRLGQLDFALDHITRANELAPDDPNVLTKRAALYLRLNRGEDAIDDFARLTDLGPKDPVAWGNLGAAYLRFAKFEMAVESLTRALSISPAYTAALLNRARALTSIGEFDLALRDLDVLVGVSKGSATAHFWRAWTSFHKGDPENSILDLETAIAKQPDLTSALALLGYAKLLRGEAQEGFQSIEKALSINPEDSLALDVSGLLLMGAERFFAANQNFKHVIRTTPNHADAYFHLAISLLELHARRPQKSLYERVIGNLNQAVTYRPHFPDAYAARAMVQRMLLEKEKADFDLETAFDQDPDNAGAFVMRGTIAYLDGDLEAAEIELARALELEPGNNGARLARAWVLLEKGDFEAVFVDLEASTSKRPTTTNDAWLNRALVHFALGEFEQSSEALSAIRDSATPDSLLPLWRYLAEARLAKTDVTQGPLQAAATGYGGEWPGPLYSFFLGEIDGTTLASFEASLGPHEDLEVRGYSLFFRAQREILMGDFTMAR